MNYKNKSILITLLALIIISGISYWYFSVRLKMETKVPPVIQLTDDQKFDILTATSSTPVKAISDSEKKNILNQTNKNVKPVKLSEEEQLEILNKTN